MHSVSLGLVSPLPGRWTLCLHSGETSPPHLLIDIPPLMCFINQKGGCHCHTWPYKGKRGPAMIWFCPVSEPYINLRPFKGTWCGQRKRPQAVHPFSSLLQCWCLQALSFGNINHKGVGSAKLQGGKPQRAALTAQCCRHLSFHYKPISQAGLLTFRVNSHITHNSVGHSTSCYE